MRNILFFIFLVWIPCVLLSQKPMLLSDSARISLMTVAPGDEVYSVFGHSAIRVFDPVHQVDRCYNYGTFDFEQPNFLLKFCQGRLLYTLDVESYRGFVKGNIRDRRDMKEQVLNLDKAEKQRLYDLIQVNLLPENREYKYDFFYDNCATRIRDIVKETFFHQITLDAPLNKGTTMRQLLQPYLERHGWLDYGIDLVLGMPADKVATPEDFMFLPDGLHDVFKNSKTQNGTLLVTSETNIPENMPSRSAFIKGLFDQPIYFMGLLAVIGLVFHGNARVRRIFDTFFWAVLGIAGVIIFLLWFATDHSATKMNLNILWALPTHLFFAWKKPEGQWTKNYFLATAFLGAIVLLAWKWMPQELPIPAIPIIVLAVIKAWYAGTGK